jgi:signal transduction histidine kinase
VVVELENHLTAEPPPETRVILYRIAIEALANVQKHSGARLVLVRLENADKGWRVQIDDDGSGFTPNGNGSAPGHLGLTAMRERAQIAGGWWKLESHPRGRYQRRVLAAGPSGPDPAIATGVARAGVTDGRKTAM